MSLSPNVEDWIPPTTSPNTAPVVLEMSPTRSVDAPYGAVVVMTDATATRTIIQARPGDVVRINGEPTSFKARVPAKPKPCAGAFSFSDDIDAPKYYQREPLVLIARKIRRGAAANIWQVALGSAKTGKIVCAACQSETCESIVNKSGIIKVLPNTRWACITRLGKVGARLWDEAHDQRKRRRKSKLDQFVEKSKANAKAGISVPFDELYSLNADAVKAKLKRITPPTEP